MMNFTTEQQQAIETHDRNVIVVAGAGSGKTRVLVSRYLALLEAHDWDINALVAITFTNKAAQEMRDRVRQQLQERVAASETADQRERWSVLLSTMDSARIATIHSLCAGILRANAAQVGIDPRFRVLEPVESETLLKDVIERIVFQLTESDASEPMLRLFTEYELSDVQDALLALVLAHPNLPEMPRTPPELLAWWHELWARSTRSLIHLLSIGSTVTETLEWLSQTSQPANDKLTNSVHDAMNALTTLRDYQVGDPLESALDPLNAIAALAVGSRGSPKAWGGSEAAEDVRIRLREIKAWAKEMLKVIPPPPDTASDHLAAELIPLWIALIERVQAAYRSLKLNEDLLDFTDLERMSVELLTHDPNVAERYIGTAFKHVLVDEFQDTNTDQWAIIERLTDPTRSSDGEAARLFIVGDPKQSIYAFRGADVRVFDQVRDLLNRLPANQPAAEIPLVKSFRTHQPLVNAFNGIFERLMVRDPHSIIGAYEVEYGKPMTAHRTEPPVNIPPITLLLIDEHERDALSGAYLVKDGGKGLRRISADDKRAWEAAEIAKHLKTLITAQHPIYDRETGTHRPIQYGDVALLFQTMNNVLIYEEALRGQGIDYVTIAGHGYYNRPEVQDVLALLQTLHNIGDDLALATALRSPMFGLSDEALYALRLYHDPRTGKRPRLWDALQVAAEHNTNRYLPDQDRAAVNAAYRIFKALSATAGRVTIFALIRDALAQTGYLATLSALPDGERRRANVEKLLTEALNSGHVTLSAFVPYLRDMSSREFRESEAETDIGQAVQLMTVHASKGLEFPLVVLPDASWIRGYGGKPPLLRLDDHYGLICRVPESPEHAAPDHRSPLPFIYQQIKNIQNRVQEAERKRLLYVAMTRAQDHLLISGWVKGTENAVGWKSNGWLDWLLAVLDLRDEQLDPQIPTRTIQRDWGTFQVHYPVERLHENSLTRDAESNANLWEHDRVQKRLPFDIRAKIPPLVEPLPPMGDRYAYNLSATDIGDLGSAEYDMRSGKRFRQRVDQDAPDRVRTVSNPKVIVPARILGDIVHEALRWWHFPDDENDLTAELTSYAWKHGIVEPQRIASAIGEARSWLRGVQNTSVYHWQNEAQHVFRELPFIYKTDKRVIHGIVDVLLQKADGTWVIVDYKSSTIKGYSGYDEAERANKHLLENHVKRYHLQVGVYAVAVERFLRARGLVVNAQEIKVYIHYLRYKVVTQVTYADWVNAVAQLEKKIGKVLEVDG